MDSIKALPTHTPGFNDQDYKEDEGAAGSTVFEELISTETAIAAVEASKQNKRASQTTPTHDIMDLSMMSWMYDVMARLHIKTHYFNAMIVTPPSHPLRHTCDDHGITSWLETSRP